MTDMVNHPPHYRQKYSWLPHECIWYASRMTYTQGNAFKYVWRAGDKLNELEDWKKALWYVEYSLTEFMPMHTVTFGVSWDVFFQEERDLREHVMYSLLTGYPHQASDTIRQKIKELEA